MIPTCSLVWNKTVEENIGSSACTQYCYGNRFFLTDLAVFYFDVYSWEIRFQLVVIDRWIMDDMEG